MASQLGYVTNNQFQHQCTWFMDITYINKDTLQAETVTFGYPLTIDYSIVKNTDANTNTATFRIHNLNPKTRASLFQERFEIGVKKIVSFYAGYNGQEKQVFKGYVMECYSEKNGAEIITNMECWDIGITEKWTALTFNKGTTFKEAYKHVANMIPEMEIGAIGDLNGTFRTETTFVGTPFDILNKISNYHTFIDNGQVNTLQNNECLDVPVYKITSSTGLLNIPQRRGGQVVVQTLFQPSIKIGQLYEIESQLNNVYDGVYKVYGFSHQGTISGSTSGQRTTEINLLIGAILPNSNYVYTYSEETGFKKVKVEDVSNVETKYGSSVEEVYRYIRDTKGKIPDKKITKNISWREMIGNDNTDNDRYNELTKSKLYNCETIAQGLQRYKDAYYPSQSLQIISGWRSSANNSSVGGQNGKAGHLYGNSIDFHIIGVNDMTVWNNSLKNYWKNHFGYSLVHKNHIHIQNDRAGK